MLPADHDVPTLDQLRRSAPWVWLCCAGFNCSHSRPVALVPFVIRWGSGTSSNRLRRSARCSACNHKGAMTINPGMAGQLTAPFPVDRAEAR